MNSLALHFPDVDWSNKEILVSKALSKFPAKDGVHRWEWKIGQTKTKRSIRRVALSDDMLHYLNQMRQAAKDPNGLIFSNKDGYPLDPDVFDSLFAEVRKTVSESRIRPRSAAFLCLVFDSAGLQCEVCLRPAWTFEHSDDVRHLRAFVSEGPHSSLPGAPLCTLVSPFQLCFARCSYSRCSSSIDIRASSSFRRDSCSKIPALS